MVRDLEQDHVEALLDRGQVLLLPKSIQAHVPERFRGPVALANDMEGVLRGQVGH